MSDQRLSILVEEDEILPLPQAAGGALQGGLLALGTVVPTTLALAGVAYAPLVALGSPVNPVWMIWSGMAAAFVMLAMTRAGGAIFGVRPGVALLYGSTLITCIGLAPTLKLGAVGVLGLAAATMTLAALMIWLALRTGVTSFARYLPAPVGRGLSLGFGLTILWMQGKTILGWFVDLKKWAVSAPSGSIAGLFMLVILVYLVLSWRKKHPSKPYLLALLPVSVLAVAGLEYVTSIPFGWLSTPPVAVPADLLPPFLPAAFASQVLRPENAAVFWSVITVLAAQALFVAFTFLVDSAGNAANIEQLTGDAYDLNGELAASAFTMAVLPWFGMVPASALIAATRPLYDAGIKNGRAIRMANLVVGIGLASLLALVWLGLNRLPVLFVVASLIVIGVNLLDPNLFERPGRGVGERQLWWQTWLIGLVFLITSGIFAMVAGFAVAVAQLVRGAEVTVVRSIYTLREIRSRKWRGEEEEMLLRRAAGRAVVVALQGTASFAVARRIREEISRIVQPSQMDVLLIDAHRVTQWDVTALEAFKRMADEFQRTHVELMLSHPSDDARRALQETVKLFANTDKALEWAENEVLRRQGVTNLTHGGNPYAKVTDLPVLAPLGEAARTDLASFGKVIAVASGHPVFNVGDADGSLLMVLAGNVSIELAGATEPLRVATFGPGMVFGEMAFLDGSARSARAFAVNSCLLFTLTRPGFAAWSEHYPRDAQVLLTALATQLSQRLRATTGQLIALNP